MPSYISHAIMGEQLYNKSVKDYTIFKIPISIDELKGYSLGTDLSYLSKRMTKDPQNFRTRDFFLNMIKYIKDNKLNQNQSIMALLYGHIAHYFLDTNTHPLIYYIECGCEKVGIISNHDLVEGYLSSYLTKKVLDKNIMEIKSDYFTKINLSDTEVSNLLNSIYGQIYEDPNIIYTYKKVISLFKLLEDFIKSGLISKEFLIKFTQFNTFLEKNNLTLDELTNNSHYTYTNPVTGTKHNESFFELYNRAIQMTLEVIQEVNKYIYDGIAFDNLEKIFLDLSYDTGAKSSLGNKMTYVRRKTLK